MIHTIPVTPDDLPPGPFWIKNGLAYEIATLVWRIGPNGLSGIFEHETTLHTSDLTYQQLKDLGLVYSTDRVTWMPFSKIAPA